MHLPGVSLEVSVDGDPYLHVANQNVLFFMSYLHNLVLSLSFHQTVTLTDSQAHKLQLQEQVC